MSILAATLTVVPLLMPTLIASCATSLDIDGLPDGGARTGPKSSATDDTGAGGAGGGSSGGGGGGSAGSGGTGGSGGSGGSADDASADAGGSGADTSVPPPDTSDPPPPPPPPPPPLDAGFPFPDIGLPGGKCKEDKDCPTAPFDCCVKAEGVCGLKEPFFGLCIKFP